MVGLAKFVDCYPMVFFGGMQQRVAIAQALANSPRVLLIGCLAPECTDPIYDAEEFIKAVVRT